MGLAKRPIIYIPFPQAVFVGVLAGVVKFEVGHRARRQRHVGRKLDGGLSADPCPLAPARHDQPALPRPGDGEPGDSAADDSAACTAQQFVVDGGRTIDRQLQGEAMT